MPPAQTRPDPSPTMADDTPAPTGSFRRFFLRGVAIILPTVLTIWVLVLVYGFVQTNIAAPINWGIREVLLLASDWPQPTPGDLLQAAERLPDEQRYLLEDAIDHRRAEVRAAGRAWRVSDERAYAIAFMAETPQRVRLGRRVAMERQWNSIGFAGFRAMDLIGLLVAVVVIYFTGLFLSHYIGRRLHARLEQFVHRVPLVSKVYPAVKQVTDFIFGEADAPMQFNRVVIVEYPGPGIWSLGLITGTSMRRMEDQTGEKTVSVFIPNSPTPFTGFVINVPESKTVDVPITIEEALKFVVSGGVLIPTQQVPLLGRSPVVANVNVNAGSFSSPDEGGRGEGARPYPVASPDAVGRGQTDPQRRGAVR